MTDAQESLLENAVEIATSINVRVALRAITKTNPDVEDTVGPRAALREAIIDAAKLLERVEHDEPELYEGADWYLVVDHLAGQIQKGRLDVDIDAALKAGGR